MAQETTGGDGSFVVPPQHAFAVVQRRFQQGNRLVRVSGLQVFLGQVDASEQGVRVPSAQQLLGIGQGLSKDRDCLVSVPSAIKGDGKVIATVQGLRVP